MAKKFVYETLSAKVNIVPLVTNDDAKEISEIKRMMRHNRDTESKSKNKGRDSVSATSIERIEKPYEDL